MRRRLFLAVAWAAVLIGGSRAGAGGEPVPAELVVADQRHRPRDHLRRQRHVRRRPVHVRAAAGRAAGIGRGRAPATWPPSTPPPAPCSSGTRARTAPCARSRSRPTASIWAAPSRRSAAARASNLAAVSTGGTVAKWNPGANRSVFVVRLGPERQPLRRRRLRQGRRARPAGIWPRSAARPPRRDGWAPSIGQITGFACPPRCSPRVFTIAFSSNGKRVYFGGHFGLVDGVARNEIASVPIGDGCRRCSPSTRTSTPPPTARRARRSRRAASTGSSPTATRIYTCGGYWKVNGTKTSYNVSAFDPEHAATC